MVSLEPQPEQGAGQVNKLYTATELSTLAYPFFIDENKIALTTLSKVVDPTTGVITVSTTLQGHGFRNGEKSNVSFQHKGTDLPNNPNPVNVFTVNHVLGFSVHTLSKTYAALSTGTVTMTIEGANEAFAPISITL